MTGLRQYFLVPFSLIPTFIYRCHIPNYTLPIYAILEVETNTWKNIGGHITTFSQENDGDICA